VTAAEILSMESSFMVSCVLVMYCVLSCLGARFDMSSNSYCANLCARPPEKFALAFVSFFPSLLFSNFVCFMGPFRLFVFYMSSEMGYNTFTIRLKG